MGRSLGGLVSRDTCLCFFFGFAMVGVICPLTAIGQSRRSRANTQSIDPVREGDAVEVKYFSDWYPGTVLSFAEGKASVEYTYRGRQSTRDFPLEEMRFPNGEGHWTVWKDSTGKFKVEARYIARDETSVMIRKADGTDLTIPIDNLSLDLRQKVKKTPVTGEENKVDGAEPVRVGDRVQVRAYSTTWYDGVVKRVLIGQAEVDYERSGRSETKKFQFKDIRFPNGEGRWREWVDSTGGFRIIARYISRTADEVTIRKEDGNELTIPIERLSAKIRRVLADTPITGQETMIDGANPIRVGDLVQIKSGSRWYDGKIKESRPGGALVEYKYSESSSTTQNKFFELKEIRYPNGEGHWRKWQDDSGSFEILARFLKRNATHVTLLKEDGGKINVPIDRLSMKLKRLLDQTLSLTPRPEKVEFAMSPKTTSFLSSAPDFSQLALSDVQSSNLISLQDGGFGFQLTHGDSISAAIATGGSEPWIAVGTFANYRFDGPRATRLYWTRPNSRKVVNGPAFQADERIVDYSATQSRLITVKVTEGVWEQPEMFCSYRVEAGNQFATPEASWEIAEKKRSYGRGSDYMVQLVGDNQLLLADGNAVSLYDFGSRRIVYTLGGLPNNRFTLHPNRQYFAVTKSGGGISLHRTSDGSQVADQILEGLQGVGFSGDGSKLVGVGPKQVLIWDLERNAAPQSLLTRNLNASSSTRITMLDDHWIWANSSIYSIDKEMVVWSYSGGGVSIAHSEMLGRHMLVAATGGGSYRGPKMALIGVAEVPHEDAIAETEKVDAESMIMLKPGVGVRIEAPGDPRIRSGLLRAIAANGWREDPNSEIVLSGKAERGKSETLTYESSRFGFAFGPRSSNRHINETVTASPWNQRVTITFRGQQAWSTGAGGIPHSLMLREGETVGGKVSDATKPSYYIFEKLKIPAEMLYPQYRNGLGRTSITASGFQDHVNQLESENSRPAFPR